MKYILTGNFYTDGDFTIDLNRFLTEEFKKHISHKEDSYEYSVNLETDDISYVQSFLEELITSYRVSHTRYWLIPSLYNSTHDIMEALYNENVRNKSTCTCLGGNYDGTRLTLTKIDNNKKKVGGRIFFIDDTSDEIVKFYDEEDKEVDAHIGSFPCSYEIVKAGKKPKYWVYSSKTGSCSDLDFNNFENLKTSIEFGTGFDNTKKILDYGKSDICEYIRYIRQVTDIDDWFIGSREEMNILKTFFDMYCECLGFINIFEHASLWSSSESSAMTSWYWNPCYQAWALNTKSFKYGVIALRFF